MAENVLSRGFILGYAQYPQSLWITMWILPVKQEEED